MKKLLWSWGVSFGEIKNPTKTIHKNTKRKFSYIKISIEDIIKPSFISYKDDACLVNHLTKNMSVATAFFYDLQYGYGCVNQNN